MVKTLVYESQVITEMYIADSFIKRLLGYMFRNEPHHEAILIKPCNSIHTFFMKFSIDVLILNSDLKVIKKIENIEPGKIIMPQRNGEMVVESKAGMFKNISEGKKIKFID